MAKKTSKSSKTGARARISPIKQSQDPFAYDLPSFYPGAETPVTVGSSRRISVVKRDIWNPRASVDLATAKRMHESRGESGIRDECNISKKLHSYPTRSWYANPAGSDVPGIDAPGRCTVTKAGKVSCKMPKGAKIPDNCIVKKRKARAKKK